MNNEHEKESEMANSIEQTLQKTFGASLVDADVNIEAQLSKSVSDFLRAMDDGKTRVSECKIAFGD